MLLYGLELILGVYVTSLDSSKLQMAGVRRIYRPPSLVAIALTVSKKSAYHRMNRCLWGVASVHPVTLIPEVAVGLLTADTVTTG